MIVSYGGNCFSQVGKVWLVGYSLASVNFLGFMSISLLTICLMSHVVSFESTHS